jgi:hypothetical protein
MTTIYLHHFLSSTKTWWAILATSYAPAQYLPVKKSHSSCEHHVFPLNFDIIHILTSLDLFTMLDKTIENSLFVAEADSMEFGHGFNNDPQVSQVERRLG